MKKLIWIFFLFPFLTKSQSIVVGDTISTNIVYNNIKDAVLLSNWTYDLDIEGDNINDIRFEEIFIPNHGFSTTYNKIYSLSNIEFPLIPSSTYVDSTSFNAIIDNSLNWNDASSGLNLFYLFIVYFPSPSVNQAGVFIRPNNYLAFRKINPSDTIYGWILLDMTRTSSISMKVKSFCYEAKGVGIKITY
ncbi:MAG: hypothetical protein IPJ32_19250 [Sphingobacteriaceae bacterium]|nr:hypothetical protein [Sphingobacteriaceae bacterium]